MIKPFHCVGTSGVVQTEEGARDTRDVWINTSETIAEVKHL